MKNVVIYTDGACSGNPGKGGWCAILSYMEHEKVLSGGEPLTTNNRMELLAVCSGLEALNQPCNVDLYSDSNYVVLGVSEGWVYNWKRENWRKGKTNETKNIDLWERLLVLLDKHNVTFKKVKGHSDNELNNRCDKIARAEALNQ